MWMTEVLTFEEFKSAIRRDPETVFLAHRHVSYCALTFATLIEEFESFYIDSRQGWSAHVVRATGANFGRDRRHRSRKQTRLQGGQPRNVILYRVK